MNPIGSDRKASPIPASVTLVWNGSRGNANVVAVELVELGLDHLAVSPQIRELACVGISLPQPTHLVASPQAIALRALSSKLRYARTLAQDPSDTTFRIQGDVYDAQAYASQALALLETEKKRVDTLYAATGQVAQTIGELQGAPHPENLRGPLTLLLSSVRAEVGFMHGDADALNKRGDEVLACVNLFVAKLSEEAPFSMRLPMTAAREVAVVTEVDAEVVGAFLEECMDVIQTLELNFENPGKTSSLQAMETAQKQLETLLRGPHDRSPV